jgi:hypothetical protein
MSTINEILNRLIRVESKISRGFEELGISTDGNTAWLRVDDINRTVHITTLGRSLAVILSDMQRLGATQIGKEYVVMHGPEVVGTVILRPLT